MPPTSTLVVTDNEDPARFGRTLVQALKVLPAATELVAVTDRPNHVPDKVRRRIRVVRLRNPQETRAAIAAEAAANRLVVVACASVRLAAGWLTSCESVARSMPHHIGVLGTGGHLVVVPPDVRSLEAAEAPLISLAGITLGCAVARHQRPSRPVKISACLIVKDEEDVLGDCLEALSASVDEIIVYDTGSADATVAIAEAHGAVVVRGYWNNHFGDARNRALAHATGDWVLSVDADEVLTGDTTTLRDYCARAEGDVMRVPLINTTWKGAEDGQLFQPLRLFRRERCAWTGALHEFLVEHEGRPALVMSALVPPVRLEHSGYQYLTFTAKDKTTRNLDIARAGVDAALASGEDPITAWDGYGRSLLTAGRHRESLEALEHVLTSRSNSSAVLQSGRAALACMGALGDFSRADDWITALEEHGESPGNVQLARARCAIATGDLYGAEEALRRAEERTGADRWGVAFDPIATRSVHAELALQRGEPSAALEILVAALQRRPESITLPGLLQVAALARAPMADLARRLPDAFLARSAQEAVVVPTDQGDAWLTALHEHRPDDPGFIVAGTVVGARSTLERAVAWSTAARRAGLAQLCPLRQVAAQEERSLVERALAWGLLVDVAGEGDALPALAELLGSADDDDRDAALGTLSALAPGSVVALGELVFQAGTEELTGAGAS